MDLKHLLIFAIAINGIVSTSAEADEIVDGIAWVYPFDWSAKRDRPAERPGADTVVIQFRIPDGITGDSESHPDPADGRWRGKFAVIDGAVQDKVIVLEPRWLGGDDMPYFPVRTSERVPLPHDARKIIRIHFYEAIRHARRLRNDANGLISGIKQSYQCANLVGNNKILDCWATDQHKKKVEEARDRADEAIEKLDTALDVFRQVAEVRKLDELNTSLWPKAQLELSVGRFCEAAKTFGEINIEREVPGKTDASYSRPYSTEAMISCGQVLEGGERHERVLEGMTLAESFVADAAFLTKRDALRRFYRDWFELFRLMTDYPDDVANLAHAIEQTPSLAAHWNSFRAATSHIPNPASTPESSTREVLQSYCVAFDKPCSGLNEVAPAAGGRHPLPPN